MYTLRHNSLSKYTCIFKISYIDNFQYDILEFLTLTNILNLSALHFFNVRKFKDFINYQHLGECLQSLTPWARGQEPVGEEGGPGRGKKWCWGGCLQPHGCATSCWTSFLLHSWCSNWVTLEVITSPSTPQGAHRMCCLLATWHL